MSVYMTEEEQLDIIKKWWKKYSNIITVILSIILLMFAGFRYWSWHEEKLATYASNTYEKMIMAFSQADSKTVRSYAKQLINDHEGSVYADVAHLILAKLFVTKGHFDKALTNLDFVAAHSKVLALKQVAVIRMARLYAAEKAYDKALAKLELLDQSMYEPVVYELKGDIYAAMQKYNEAISAYKKAITDSRTSGLGNLFLEMKTNELASYARSNEQSAFTKSAGINI